MNQEEKRIAYIDPELEELMHFFFENTWDEIRSMQEALENEDYEILERLGHNIKGSSLGYGLEEMGKIGLGIENAAKERKRIDEIQVLTNDLISYMDNVEVVYK